MLSRKKSTNFLTIQEYNVANIHIMKTQDFLNALTNYRDLELVFSYSDGKLIKPGYHITEVKNINIDSVDCGGKTDSWNETIIQLWESPLGPDEDVYMSADKANQILQKVDSLRTMDKEAVVKFEYGNENFHAAQLQVAEILPANGRLTVLLSDVPTDCKAKTDCGVAEPVAANSSAACEPGSGCC